MVLVVVTLVQSLLSCPGRRIATTPVATVLRIHEAGADAQRRVGWACLSSSRGRPTQNPTSRTQAAPFRDRTATTSLLATERTSESSSVTNA